MEEGGNRKKDFRNSQEVNKVSKGMAQGDESHGRKQSQKGWGAPHQMVPQGLYKVGGCNIVEEEGGKKGANHGKAQWKITAKQ